MNLRVDIACDVYGGARLHKTSIEFSSASTNLELSGMQLLVFRIGSPERNLISNRSSKDVEAPPPQAPTMVEQSRPQNAKKKVSFMANMKTCFGGGLEIEQDGTVSKTSSPEEREIPATFADKFGFQSPPWTFSRISSLPSSMESSPSVRGSFVPAAGRTRRETKVAGFRSSMVISLERAYDVRFSEFCTRSLWLTLF